MIKTYHLNPNKPENVSDKYGNSKTPAESKGVTQEEFDRRNAIIQKLVAQCPYKQYDLVVDAKGTQYRVTSICNSYLLMGNDEPWREYPFLVTLRNQTAPNNISTCTINYVNPIKEKVFC
jgi:hypothetical protein